MATNQNKASVAKPKGKELIIVESPTKQKTISKSELSPIHSSIPKKRLSPSTTNLR